MNRQFHVRLKPDVPPTAVCISGVVCKWGPDRIARGVQTGQNTFSEADVADLDPRRFESVLINGDPPVEPPRRPAPTQDPPATPGEAGAAPAAPAHAHGGARLLEGLVL